MKRYHQKTADFWGNLKVCTFSEKGKAWYWSTLQRIVLWKFLYQSELVEIISKLFMFVGSTAVYLYACTKLNMNLWKILGTRLIEQDHPS